MAAFVTLTYRDDAVPRTSASAVLSAMRRGLPTLDPDDLQTFLKRLRFSFAAKTAATFRFFAVGEYGSRTQRPHYHLALFGFPGCRNGRTNHLLGACCSVCEMVKDSWQKGGVDVGELTVESAKYIAGYCEKKWKKEDVCQERRTIMGISRPTHLTDGRHREFSRMSLKPGIGAIAIMNLASSGAQSPRGKSVIKSLDAPVVLRNSGSILPLGRYLKRKWREALGRGPDTPEQVLGQYRKELWSMLKKDEVEHPSKAGSSKAKAQFQHWRKNIGAIVSLECRSKIYKAVKTI